MVHKQSMIFMAISSIICFGFPVLLMIYFRKKEKISLRAVVVGILMFMLFQMVLRLPLINYMNLNPIFLSIMKSSNMIYIGFLAITAGIFEEVGRYVGFKYFLKDKLKWENGIAYGIGHGGIEAMALVGWTIVTNLLFSIIINIGAFDGVLKKMPQAKALNLRDTLINTPSYMFLLGGVERIFIIIFHIALSIIVLEGVVKKNNTYLLYAILIHALVNYVAAFNSNVFITEGILFIVAISSIRFIFNSKKRFKCTDNID
ncbi:YhfC family intramembrane metalloprotease [Clostridium bovifaecis]|uniref:YhfC family intramembrane metalloprotease n=1 Tax=Clostridium bovifaecis TaxID=2184719 RepID=A0A6I6EJW3_9CLOT|nr:YhfC family intramembrane metalloprotease [Clostridium bovifaecis]